MMSAFGIRTRSIMGPDFINYSTPLETPQDSARLNICSVSRELRLGAAERDFTRVPV